MAVDLLSRVRSRFDASVVRDLGVTLDELPDRVERTLSLGAPAILAGLARVAHEPGGAARALEALGRDPVAAAGPGPAPREGSPEDLARRGDPLLRSVFGDRLGGVIDLISDEAGARSSSVAALLGALVPAIAGAVRDAIAGRGAAPAALRTLLAGQAEAFARQAPAGLADVLEVRSLADFADATPAVAASPRGRGAAWMASARSGPRWVAPVALGTLALVVGFLMMPRKIDPDATQAPPPAEPAANRPATGLARGSADSPPPADARPADAVTPEGRPLREAAARRVSLALPGGVKLEVPAGSYLEGMVRALRGGKPAESRSFVAAELTFDGEGSLTPEAEDSIAQLARVAEAFPGVKLRIEGRETLRDVEPEKAREAALRRAEAVREALVRAGVAGDRVAAGTVAADLPAEHPAAVAESDVPIRVALVAE